MQFPLTARTRIVTGLIVVLGAWAICWGEGLLDPASLDTGPPGWVIPVVNLVAALALGALFPRVAWLVGPVLLAPGLLWTILHLAMYDGSEGASFAGLGFILLPIGMVILSVIARISAFSAASAGISAPPPALDPGQQKERPRTGHRKMTGSKTVTDG